VDADFSDPISYSHLVSVVQTNLDFDGKIDWAGVEKTLARMDDVDGLGARTRAKGEAVLNWLDTNAPENVRFSVQKDLPDISLDDIEIKFLTALDNALGSVDWKPGIIHDTIYDTSLACEIKAGLCFKALYKIFIGKERGPRLGFLLASLDRDFVLGRVKAALS